MRRLTIPLMTMVALVGCGGNESSSSTTMDYSANSSSDLVCKNVTRTSGTRTSQMKNVNKICLQRVGQNFEFELYSGANKFSVSMQLVSSPESGKRTYRSFQGYTIVHNHGNPETITTQFGDFSRDVFRVDGAHSPPSEPGESLDRFLKTHTLKRLWGFDEGLGLADELTLRQIGSNQFQATFFRRGRVIKVLSLYLHEQSPGGALFRNDNGDNLHFLVPGFNTLNIYTRAGVYRYSLD